VSAEAETHIKTMERESIRYANSIPGQKSSEQPQNQAKELACFQG